MNRLETACVKDLAKEIAEHLFASCECSAKNFNQQAYFEHIIANFMKDRGIGGKRTKR